MENARSDLLRVRDLVQSGAVSKSAGDAAEARATVTEAQYQSAFQKKALVDLGPRLEEKDALRAQVRQLEAAMKMARLQLEYACLRAPFNGMVAQRLSDEGTFVTTTTPIYLFIQTVATKIRYILAFWCHCERSEAISPISRLLRRKAPRNDSFPLVGLRCI